MYEPISEYWLREQEAQIDGRVVTSGRAARHQPAAARQALEAALPRRLADVLDHHVDAAVVREPPDLGRRHPACGG